MSRMKTFLIYAVVIVLFYFLSNILIYLFLNGTYKDMKGDILSKNIEITNAKATYVNGYIDGKVLNNTGNTISNKYVKIDIYSERENHLGTKYIEITELDIGETQDFHIGYKFTDSYKFEVSIVESIESATDEQFLSEELQWYAIASTLLLILFI